MACDEYIRGCVACYAMLGSGVSSGAQKIDNKKKLLRWGARRFLYADLALVLVLSAVMDAFFALSSSSTVGSSLSASSKSKERFGNDFSGILWVHFSGPIFQHAKILKDPKFRTSTQNLHKFIGGCSKPLGRAWSVASSSHRAAKMGWGALFKNGMVLKSLTSPPSTSATLNLCRYDTICVSQGKNCKLGHIYTSYSDEDWGG